MKNSILEVVNNHKPDVFKENFINHIPKRLDLAISLNMDEQTKSRCNDVDYIDYHLRRYLTGQQPNLRRLFFEIRRFLKNGHYSGVITRLIADLKEFILQEEFYELMPRLESSSIKIQKLIKNYYQCP